MNRTYIAVAVATLALAACTPEFDPASKLEKLRVLAIQAEPPEIEPAGAGTVAPDRATLTSLILRADLDADPVRTTTVVHLACVPIPGDPTPTACVQLATLRDPAAEIAAGVRRACAGEGPAPEGGWPAIALAGFEACAGTTCGPAVAGGIPLPRAELVVPAGFAFPPSGAERILGIQAIVLAFALEATPDELVAGMGTTCPAGVVADNLARLWPVREHVLSSKRVVIRGPEAPDAPNLNPAIEGIRAGAAILDPDAMTTLVPGLIPLAPIVPSGAAGEPEEYTKLDAAGLPIEVAREEWVYSWFSTAGELDELHTRGAEADAWIARASPPALVVAVVRDLRGGTAWAVRTVAVGP
jgi:hypothetical protein